MYKRNNILIILFVILLFSLKASTEEFTIYQVRKGDSLSLIANSYQVDIKEIIEINDIKDPNLIYIGQEIKIPTLVNTYTVKKGDSLWEIAKAYNIELQDLINTNKISSPDKIYVGQKLYIPVNSNRTRYTLASRSRNPNYIWPVQGRISSEYGWRIHPIRKQKEFHTGLDIAAPFGTPVYAADSGTVYFSGWAEGYGNLVIIKHANNHLTYYGHNLSLLVSKGDKVKQGKVIALVGDTGIATGPHLHFEIRINNRHVNPMEYLNQRYLINGFKI